jgi:hypothetical protein
VTFEELKMRRNGQGLGGPLALILMLFVSIAIPFIAGSEVGNMYAEDGMEKPVTGNTGWWILIPIAGAIIWFVKLQGALNRYWESQGGAVAAPADEQPAAPPPEAPTAPADGEQA